MRRMIAASVARRIALKKMGAGAIALAAPMQVLAAVSDAGKPLAKARRIVSVSGADAADRPRISGAGHGAECE